METVSQILLRKTEDFLDTVLPIIALWLSALKMTINRIKEFGKYTRLCDGDEAATNKHNIGVLSIERKYYKFKLFQSNSSNRIAL